MPEYRIMTLELQHAIRAIERACLLSIGSEFEADLVRLLEMAKATSDLMKVDKPERGQTLMTGRMHSLTRLGPKDQQRQVLPRISYLLARFRQRIQTEGMAASSPMRGLFPIVPEQRSRRRLSQRVSFPAPCTHHPFRSMLMLMPCPYI